MRYQLILFVIVFVFSFATINVRTHGLAFKKDIGNHFPQINASKIKLYSENIFNVWINYLTTFQKCYMFKSSSNVWEIVYIYTKFANLTTLFKLL